MRACLMPPACPPVPARPSPAIPEFGYIDLSLVGTLNRPVPCGWGYNLIDLSLGHPVWPPNRPVPCGVRLNRPVPWDTRSGHQVPSESELCRHGEQVAALRHAPELVDPAARPRPFFQARAGGLTAQAKSRREKSGHFAKGLCPESRTAQLTLRSLFRSSLHHFASGAGQEVWGCQMRPRRGNGAYFSPRLRRRALARRSWRLG